MKHQILVVEDEPSIAELIAVNLEHHGYEVKRANQVIEANHLIKDSLPSLIILDWMLPGQSGVQYAQELRSDPETALIPILMLTAKSEEADKVLGLDSGADDYMTKPFSVKEFLARVKALLRRYHVADEVQKKIILGRLCLDLDSHKVTALVGEQEPVQIILGPTEFRLLHFLMSKPERVHTRANLLDQVWGNDSYIEDRTVDVHIKRLRAALAPTKCDIYVETVRGAGYRMTDSPQNNS